MLKKPAPVIVIAASVLLQACQPSGPRPKDDQPWVGKKESPTELTMQFSVGWSEEVHYTYFLGEGEGSVVELRILNADLPQWEFAEEFEWPGGLRGVVQDALPELWASWFRHRALGGESENIDGQFVRFTVEADGISERVQIDAPLLEIREVLYKTNRLSRFIQRIGAGAGKYYQFLPLDSDDGSQLQVLPIQAEPPESR